MNTGIEIYLLSSYFNNLLLICSINVYILFIIYKLRLNFVEVFLMIGWIINWSSNILLELDSDDYYDITECIVFFGVGGLWLKFTFNTDLLVI